MLPSVTFAYVDGTLREKRFEKKKAPIPFSLLPLILRLEGGESVGDEVVTLYYHHHAVCEVVVEAGLCFRSSSLPRVYDDYYFHVEQGQVCVLLQGKRSFNGF